MISVGQPPGAQASTETRPYLVAAESVGLGESQCQQRGPQRPPPRQSRSLVLVRVLVRLGCVETVQSSRSTSPAQPQVRRRLAAQCVSPVCAATLREENHSRTLLPLDPRLLKKEGTPPPQTGRRQFPSHGTFAFERT